MATPTYDLLDSNVVTGTPSSITFSSLDTLASGYRDLVIICTLKTNGALNALFMRFNGDTGSNYSRVSMTGNGSTASSYSGTGDSIRSVIAQLDNTNFNETIFQIFDFSQTDKHKSVLARMNNTGQGVEAGAYRWASTSAITSVTIFPDSNQFVSGTTIYLYGISS